MHKRVAYVFWELARRSERGCAAANFLGTAPRPANGKTDEKEIVLMRQIKLGLALVILTSTAPFTAAQAATLYNIGLAGDSAAIGTLDWAGDLSSDGAFSRELSDINALSITVGGVTFTAGNELGPFSDAQYEVTSGELVRFDATLTSGPDALIFGVQHTGDGGLSSDEWNLNGYFPKEFSLSLSGSYTLTPVPEPSPLALAALGLLYMDYCRRKRTQLH
ncbi:MAG: hypothetical protein CMJ72_08250 [Planctomycetaceae bacterium]|nr:hypothetical protein [Planctomycetaceae bacterium]